MPDVEFFDRLYQGFRAEYYVMGQLFGVGFEAYKMPADFGFDLVVTNQREICHHPEIAAARVLQPPYVIQVKSRRISEVDFGKGPNGRPEARVRFKLTGRDFHLIETTENAFLVCVVFVENFERKLENRTLMFWLNSPNIQLMKRKFYFEKETHDNGNIFYNLDLCIRFLPRVDIDIIIADVEGVGDITANGKEKLKRMFPKSVEMNWNAKEYIAITRKNLSECGKTVDRIIEGEMLSLAYLGHEIYISDVI